MPEARYDAVADFYATAFNAIDDPASAALIDLPADEPASSPRCAAGTAG